MLAQWQWLLHIYTSHRLTQTWTSSCSLFTCLKFKVTRQGLLLGPKHFSQFFRCFCRQNEVLWPDVPILSHVSYNKTNVQYPAQRHTDKQGPITQQTHYKLEKQLWRVWGGKSMWITTGIHLHSCVSTCVTQWDTRGS